MMDEMERISACAMNGIFGYEPRIARRIIDELGSCRALFSLDGEQLRGIIHPGSKYYGRVGPAALDGAERELRRLDAAGYSFLPVTGEDYPQVLRDCEDGPVGLYLRSETAPKDLFRGPLVSIVGTRDVSPYGREWCRRIVEALSGAARRPTIVSGLAFGVDITAHRAALECGLGTLAVLPTGIDDVYPLQHAPAAACLGRTAGCGLLTDFPPGTRSMAATFLRRNRIIAALGKATILVESKVKGGGMMTARLAFDYGREVFALPGRIDDPRSGGCNLLVREKVAEPIVSLPDLPDQLGLGGSALRRKADLAVLLREKYAALPPERRDALVRIALQVKSFRGISVEDLCRTLGLGYPDVIAGISTLESDGILSQDLLQRCTINTKIT